MHRAASHNKIHAYQRREWAKTSEVISTLILQQAIQIVIIYQQASAVY